MKPNKRVLDFLQGKTSTLEEVNDFLTNFHDSDIDISDLKDVVEAISLDKQEPKRWYKVYEAEGSFERQAFLLYKAYNTKNWSPNLYSIFYIMACCACIEPMLHKKEKYFDLLLTELTPKIRQ